VSKPLNKANYYTTLYERGGCCGPLVGSFGSVGVGVGTGVDLGGGTGRGGGDGGAAPLGSAGTLCAKRAHRGDANMGFDGSTFRPMGLTGGFRM
jgi:hypothetical protein